MRQPRHLGRLRLVLPDPERPVRADQRDHLPARAEHDPAQPQRPRPLSTAEPAPPHRHHQPPVIPMPLLDSGDELSLRHIPDVSDASFSFQIPGTAQNENLLADVDLDFFRGADLSVTAQLAAPSVSPSAPANAAERLTLSQLTPRPSAEEKKEPQNSRKAFPILSWQPSQDSSPKREKVETNARPQRPELKLNTNNTLSPKARVNQPTPLAHPPVEGSPIGVRLDVPRVEVDAVKDEPPVELSIDNQVSLAAHDDRRPKGIRRRSLEKNQTLIRDERREKLGPRYRQKLIEGGITKTRRINTYKLAETAVRAVRGSMLTQQADPAFPSSRRPALTEELKGDEPSLADTSVTSSLGGVAACLVQYGQQLLNSFGSDISAPANLIPTVASQSFVPVSEKVESGGEAHVEPVGAEEDDRDEPLTLSQLSPRKVTMQSIAPGPATPPANEPISPLRPSTKRPTAVVSEKHHIRKKSKGDATSTLEIAPRKVLGSGSSTNPKPQLPPTRRNPRPANLTSSSSGPSSKPAERAISRPKNRIVSLPKPASAFKREWNDDLTVKSTSTSMVRSRISRSQSNLDNKDTMTIEPANPLKDKVEGLTTLASSSSSKSDAKPVFGEHEAPPLRATTVPGPEGLFATRTRERRGQETAEPLASKPQSRSQSHSSSRTRSQSVSQSQSQSQSHSRSTSSQSQGEKRYQFYHPVPDFKALHATREAELARLKENIHPTIPLPMVWETDVRAEERRKFDEKLKEKERELERLEEARRRQRELEEEREVRELRKRAVPKAHEVPDWYNEMPKRKNGAQ